MNNQAVTGKSESYKVLVLAPSAYILGGVQVWLSYLLPGLSNRGFDCWLGLTEGAHHSSTKYLEEHPWDQAVAISNPTGSSEGRRRAIEKAVNRVGPDLVMVVNIVDAYTALCNPDKAGSHRPKVVSTQHGLQADFMSDLRRFRGELDGVICTNKLACYAAQKYAGLEERRVFYAPYGIPEVRQLERESIDDTGELVIGYVGRFEEDQKRIFDIPAILQRLRKKGTQFRFYIAGSGPDEAEFLKQIGECGLTDMTLHHGVLSREELFSKFYPQIDILLVTSSWETGPIVIWEAMAHGVAVVSSKYVGSGLEGALVNGHNSLLFPIGDADAASKQIERLTDSEYRAEIARRGMETVESRYTESRSVHHWERALKTVLASDGRCSSGVERNVKPRGRLDRFFGIRIAERIRSALRISYEHASPGGEWPHTYSSAMLSDKAFRDLVISADKSGREH